MVNRGNGAGGTAKAVPAGGVRHGRRSRQGAVALGLTAGAAAAAAPFSGAVQAVVRPWTSPAPVKWLAIGLYRRSTASRMTCTFGLVGMAGFEPAASCSQSTGSVHFISWTTP